MTNKEALEIIKKAPLLLSVDEVKQICNKYHNAIFKLDNAIEELEKYKKNEKICEIIFYILFGIFVISLIITCIVMGCIQ